MTQNLRLVGARTLTSADSNVTANFALPASSSNWGTSRDVARTYDTGNASYGVFYNWYTATAGSGTSAVTSGNAVSSICPKGWTLPTSAQLNALYNAYGDASSFISATSPVLSGFLENSSVQDLGARGVWWSRTASNATSAYELYVWGNSGVRPQWSYSRLAGMSIRCITQ